MTLLPAPSIEVLGTDGQSPDPAVLVRARKALDAGELLVYPTDTLYALGGRALDPRAARRTLQAKGRPEGKPLPLIARDLAQVEELCSTCPASLSVLAARFWPGPLTLVLPATAAVPVEVTAGTGRLAVRVPALPLARMLCDRGPLVSTSANRTGQPAPVTCIEAVAAVGGAAVLALDAGTGRPTPSTIVDLTGAPTLLRPGAVPWDEVERALDAGVPGRHLLE